MAVWRCGRRLRVGGRDLRSCGSCRCNWCSNRCRGRGSGGLGEQVPDDDQEDAGNGGDGLELAPASGHAPVAFPREVAGPVDFGDGFPGEPFEVGVGLADAPGAAAVAGLDGLRADLDPGHQVAGGGKYAHAQADPTGEASLSPHRGESGRPPASARTVGSPGGRPPGKYCGPQRSWPQPASMMSRPGSGRSYRRY